MSTRKYRNYSRNKTTHQRQDRHARGKPSARKNRPYNRRIDCWNCGMGGHQKTQCPLPSSLKCSFCHRRNIRTDQCPCRSSHRSPQKSATPRNVFQEKIETAIYVKVCGKTIRARLNPSVQETMICREVANLVKEQTHAKERKLILREPGNLTMVRCISMKMSTRTQQQVTIDGIISDKITEKIIVIGMQAIKAFGFKFFIGGQEAKMRVSKRISTIEVKPLDEGPSNRAPMRQRQPFQNAAFRKREDYSDDDDRMSFLDEDEARMIREMK